MKLEKMVCTKPGCVFKGKPQPIENFYTYPGGEIPKRPCKKCVLKSIKESRERRKKKDDYDFVDILTMPELRHICKTAVNEIQWPCRLEKAQDFFKIAANKIMCEKHEIIKEYK